jgi:phage-related minor tail protein
MGGPVSAGQPYLVGERGPELVVPSGSGNVIPAGKTASMLGGTTVINITTGADPQAVVAAIKKYERSNGTNWRS